MRRRPVAAGRSRRVEPGVTAAFIFRDALGRVYPSQAKRLGVRQRSCRLRLDQKEPEADATARLMSWQPLAVFSKS